MTELTNGVYVSKTHPRIIFRGAIDSFLAELMMVVSNERRCAEPDLLFLQHLSDVKSFIRQLQTAEATNADIARICLLGLDAGELRERSHHPRKYFGIDHLFSIETDTDERVFIVNCLRAKSRELEIKGIAAYEYGNPPVPESILAALNRLSSALYIIELQLVSRSFH